MAYCKKCGEKLVEKIGGMEVDFYDPSKYHGHASVRIQSEFCPNCDEEGAEVNQA